ncbi:signal peptidase II [Trichloromonas sp.]|uniref:signal peptidase II n=1 Tax=Trichloromonas sp. TaxID=3069249 RepID=UPI003D8182A4
MPFRYRLLLLVSLVVLALDQATKLYIDSRFALYESVTVFENFFHITYVRNKGAAFGILADNAFRVPFFITVASLAAIGILWYLHKLGEGQKLHVLALSLIFSGAVGNLIDRIRLGEVIDFLDAHWYQHHWPAFNVADSAICVGVGLLLLDMWRQESAKKKAAA